MLLYGCLNIDINGPLTQYLKTLPKFSRGAELQPLRASPTLSFPQTRRFGVSSFNANKEERGRSRVGLSGCGTVQIKPMITAKSCVRLQTIL